MMWLLIGLGFVLLFLVYKITSAPGKTHEVKRPVTDIRPGILDARQGDSISIPGMGENYDDLDFQVDRRDRYECGSDEWFELSGRYRDHRVYVEVVDDDELEVYVTIQPAMRLDEIGLQEDDLVRMDENEDSGESFQWDGVRWHYESSYEAGYFKDGRGEGEGFYCWDFDSDDRKRALSVTKYEGDPFEVTVSRRVSPRDVRVFRA